MDKLKKEFFENLKVSPVGLGKWAGSSTGGNPHYDFEKIWKFIETAITKAYKRGFNDGKKYCVRIIWKDPAQKVLNEHLITKAREDTLEKAYMIVYKNVLRGKGMHVDTWKNISTDLNELLSQKK